MGESPGLFCYVTGFAGEEVAALSRMPWMKDLSGGGMAFPVTVPLLSSSPVFICGESGGPVGVPCAWELRRAVA